MLAAEGTTEELFALIADIGRQVDQAAPLVTLWVVEAAETNEQMAELTETVQEIGEVVSLIRNIAGQTNLLALNATIEAARGQSRPRFCVGRLGIQTAVGADGQSDRKDRAADRSGAELNPLRRRGHPPQFRSPA